MRYEVTYEQMFEGKILAGSYVRTISEEVELRQIEEALYSDPHVISVAFTKISEEEPEWKK